MQIEFERRLMLMDPSLRDVNKLTSNTIFSFLNEAIDKFYKTRYSGINGKGEGFEQSQKRIDDLRSLVKTVIYTDEKSDTIGTIQNNGNIYSITLPSDYTLLLGDTAGILPNDDNNNICWEKDSKGKYVIKYNDTIEVQVETLDKQLNNSLSEHHLKYCNAKPLRHVQNNEVKLFTDGKYKISEYKLTYLSKPLFLDSKHVSDDEYESLPNHTHIEIVKMAIQIYLTTVSMQNNSDYSSEINKME